MTNNGETWEKYGGCQGSVKSRCVCNVGEMLNFGECAIFFGRFSFNNK